MLLGINKNLTLRPCLDSDYGAVYDLSAENMSAAVAKHWGGWDADLFRKDFRPGQITIIEHKGNFIGFFDFSRQTSAVGYLHNIQLKKDFQGQGLGRYLLDKIESQARQEGCREIRLRVFKDLPARKFYEHLGYIITDDNGDSVDMAKTIV